MKRKITIKDNINDTEISSDYESRNIYHHIVSQKHHSQIFKNKKKYNRKVKHKAPYDY